MFGLSLSHLILLSVIALVVIGPKQLPEVARVLGRFINDLKRTSGEITKSFGEMRDNSNQSFLQNQTHHEPAPVVAPDQPTPGHQPALGDQLVENRQERNQMSFEISNEKSGHGDG